MVKNIQVNEQMHKVLVALKAILMKQKQRQISFNEVIAHEKFLTYSGGLPNRGASDRGVSVDQLFALPSSNQTPP